MGFTSTMRRHVQKRRPRSRPGVAEGRAQPGPWQTLVGATPPGGATSYSRALYYRLGWIPMLLIDGKNVIPPSDPLGLDEGRIYKRYRGIVEFERAQGSALGMTLEASLGGSVPGGREIEWTCTVEVSRDVVAEDLAFRCFISEDPVEYRVEQKIEEARYVVRDLLMQGPLTVRGKGEVESFGGRETVPGDWIGSHLSLVALVQDRKTHEVVQAVVRPLGYQATPTPRLTSTPTRTPIPPPPWAPWHCCLPIVIKS